MIYRMSIANLFSENNNDIYGNVLIGKRLRVSSLIPPSTAEIGDLYVNTGTITLYIYAPGNIWIPLGGITGTPTTQSMATTATTTATTATTATMATTETTITNISDQTPNSNTKFIKL